MKTREVKISNTKLSLATIITSGIIIGVLIGFAVWNLNPVSVIGEVSR